jgi:hypothetical protein
MATLDIEELCLVVEATATPERANLLLRKVEQAVAERVSTALAALATMAGEANDAREIFIDELDVECDVSGAWEPDVIARALAAQVHRRLESAAAGALVFRDRPEYVAAFLTAVADGRADRWWFEASTGLATLSPSNALRTIVIDEGDHGVAALARLTTHEARRVIGVLNHADATRVLDWMSARAATVAVRPEVLWRHSAALPDASEHATPWLAALVEAERAAPGCAGMATRALLETLRALRRAARAGVPASVHDDDARAKLAGWCAACGRDATWIETISVDGAEAIAADLQALASDGAKAPSATRCLPDDTGWRESYTQRGGVFLLRVVLARLGWLDAWNARTGVDPDGLDTLAWLLAIKAACEPPDVAKALDDPALRVLLPRDADPHRPKARCASLRTGSRATLARQLLREFGSRLPGCAQATPRYLRANVLAFDARVFADDAVIRVEVGRAPLDVLLTLAGWKRAACTLAGGRRLDLRAA